MLYSPDTFDKLLENTYTFEPAPDDDDLYVPSSQPTTSSSQIPHSPLPSNFVVYSQNAHRSNSCMHSILSIASSMTPAADIIFIQEPYYGKIGINAGMAQGNPIFDVFGCPKHRDWQAIIPPLSSPDNKPDVIAYVPSTRSHWTFQLRADIVSSQNLMCVQVDSSSPSFFLFNVYNDVDNGACDLIASTPTPSPRSMYIGDFNLHHPLWSRDDNLNKRTPQAEHLVDLMAGNGYSILNTKGEDTYHIYRKNQSNNGHQLYTSTLDLAWVSKDLAHYVSNFQVAKHLANESDHYPLVVTLQYASSPPPRTSFSFHDKNFEAWAERFQLELDNREEIPELIYTEEDFNKAVENLTGATLAASHITCIRRVKPVRKAKWFDSKVREALKDLRKAKRQLVRAPTHHNALRHSVARKQFHYQVVVAKRSHARAFTASVKPGTDLWRLTSWYQGVRKTTVPTLKEPNSDPKFPTWVSDPKGKADLLAKSWFPNIIPPTKPFPPYGPKRPTRTFISVSPEEVFDTLKECSSDNAPGVSGLTYKVWKWVAAVAPDQLYAVVRASFSLGIHHSSWKTSLVAVIPKNNKKDMALPKSHRPIQLIECLGKLVEKIAARRVTFDLGKYNLMPPNQFGGRSHSSCLDAGIALTHDIQTARENKLVSSFLAVDIKGFFDHANHAQLLEVMLHLGFNPVFVKWVESFLQGRFVRVQVDDYVGDPHPQLVGYPQGSPISPVLACIFASVVLQILNNEPIFDKNSPCPLPVKPGSYVDDFGFHSFSVDLETTTYLLKKTLERAVNILDDIGLVIDPDKCDLMHFSWRPGDSNPSLKTTLYGKELTITPPASIRWLGFHLDRKLSFTHHVNLLAAKGLAIVNGLKVLGNTIEGISPANLRLLYNTVVIPAITYGSQLWFNPKKPIQKLVKKLEQVQRKALIAISGGFYDTPLETMQMLTFIPPITSTLTKLHRSASLRIPRLPISSEITRRLPVEYLMNTKINRWLIQPKYIPFQRPTMTEVKRRNTKSPLNRMITNIDPNMERSEPFHSQNAPHHHKLSSLPFAGRLFIDPTACPKKDRKNLVTNQRIWLTTREGRNTLNVFTDGSKTDKAAGWAVTGIHAGQVIFSLKIPFAKRASNHDAEMMAMGHASKLVLDTMLGKPDIREFRLFSDSTSALTSIFDPSPHACQQASLLFRSNMLKLFTSRTDIKGKLNWTPGHGGLDHMTITDKNAKAAANSATPTRCVLPLFVSRSAALSEMERLALSEWHKHLDNLEDSNTDVFRNPPRSGSFPFIGNRKSSTFVNTKPAKWFKTIKRSLMSQLTQMCTNHAPTGEYFKRCVWKYQDKPTSFYQCPCKHPPHNHPPTFQTRDHIIRACPIFEDARERLRRVLPGLDKPRFSLGRMVKKKTIIHTLEYLKAGPFSRKHAPHEPP